MNPAPHDHDAAPSLERVRAVKQAHEKRWLQCAGVVAVGIAQRPDGSPHIIVSVEAEAERIRRNAKGEADGILAKYMAEAEGTLKLLEAKADGYRRLVESVGGDAQAASTLLMIEKMEELVARQVEAARGRAEEPLGSDDQRTPAVHRAGRGSDTAERACHGRRALGRLGRIPSA